MGTIHISDFVLSSLISLNSLFFHLFLLSFPLISLFLSPPTCPPLSFPLICFLYFLLLSFSGLPFSSHICHKHKHKNTHKTRILGAKSRGKQVIYLPSFLILSFFLFSFSNLSHLDDDRWNSSLAVEEEWDRVLELSKLRELCLGKCCVVCGVVLCWDVLCVLVFEFSFGTLSGCRRGFSCWDVLGMCRSVECGVGIVGFRVLAWASSVVGLELCLCVFCVYVCMIDVDFVCLWLL